jgi:hypothetical protein
MGRAKKKGFVMGNTAIEGYLKLLRFALRAEAVLRTRSNG